MRNLICSVIALGTVACAGAAAPAAAQPVTLIVTSPTVQTVQYYEPGWRGREEWRRRREIEWRRRHEWRRHEELREARRPPPPLPYYGYGPRY